ncbi:MAG: biotin-independent malonate decarboxylase subunit beta, partial [Corynebacterium glutamicum]|nr:biotin-independent malonate decarboxylase subunit beta [Corynebacterium glutamicum]
LEGKFQGGGIGEVSGAKIAAALERALVDAKAGHNIRVVLLLETGGIRLQEANLGLLAIAEIHSAIVELQRYTPVVCVVAGMVGCFGGMGIAAGLCDHIIMTREGRLALNGPEVIETEAGVQELNASDRPAIWKMIGGEQRVATGRADVLSDDTVESIRAAVVAAPVTAYTHHRANNLDSFNAQLENLNPSARPTAEELRTVSV